jgi:hypothetical protein
MVEENYCMRDVPDIVKLLREEERNGLLRTNIELSKIYQNDDIYDDLWFNQWRFL